MGSRLRLGFVDGAPLWVHWSTPIGAFVLTGVRYALGAWLGFVLLIVVHELGHAMLVRRFSCQLLSIEVHGMGGQCRWTGQTSALQRAIIAWGGVLGQTIVFVPAYFAAQVLPIRDPFVGELLSALVATNVVVGLFNLLPISTLDGGEAWKILPLGFRAVRRTYLRARHRTIGKKLQSLQGVSREAGRHRSANDGMN